MNSLTHQEKHSMKHYAGLDVSIKETSICIVDETGKVCREYSRRSRCFVPMPKRRRTNAPAARHPRSSNARLGTLFLQAHSFAGSISPHLWQ